MINYLFDWLNYVATDYGTLGQKKYEIVIANQNHPMPDGELLVVNLLNVANITRGDHAGIDNNGVETVYIQYEASFSFNFYGENSLNNAIQLADSMKLDDAKILLKNQGFTIANSAININNLDVLIGSRFEKRAQFDVLFRGCRELSNTVGFIETIKGQYVFNGILSNYEVKRN